mgnify:CR=1 FL=1
MKYLLVSLLILFVNANAQEIAIASQVKGNVSARSADKTISITSGSTLDTGMILMTKKDASVTIIFKDNSKLVLGSNALLSLKKFVFKPAEEEYDFQLFLEKGSASFESGKISKLSPEDFVFKTPEAAVAIRGTKFFVKVQ